jgi:alkanesulfonate monooxygenase SsuD/methylene tetrahydromethanopterin reductase-like flavin-dependent oxidoreductase (luciferase family)
LREGIPELIRCPGRNIYIPRGVFFQDSIFCGPYYVGDPDSVAERMVDLHSRMGHRRHFLQSDFGGLPQEHLRAHLTLLATEVKPRVARLLAQK